MRWSPQAVLVVLSQGVSNFANDYMSYPTKLLFKASKLIMIMAVGRCVIGRQYHVLEVWLQPSLACRRCQPFWLHCGWQPGRPPCSSTR